MWLSFRRPSPHLTALLAFFVFYFVLVQDVRHWSYRDPSSAFFDPKRAFERKYSQTREAEAETYISTVEEWGDQDYVKAAERPSMVVGIASVQREGARYFRRAVGSVLAGLTSEERRDVYLLSFIANSDPRVHDAFGEKWLRQMSDEVLTYKNTDIEVSDHVQGLEKVDPSFDRKPLYDYIYLLQHAYELGTPYVVVLEDDVIGAEGWYYRTKDALERLQRNSPRVWNNTLYLRLFYNERILGWNSEEWPSYVMQIFVFEAAVLGGSLLALSFIPSLAAILTPLTILTLMFVVAPMFIILYFSAGRLTVSPLPYGVNRMNTYACCSQAFVFPRDQIPPLVAYYKQAGSGKIDVLTEKYADEKSLLRWALTPSVFAHVGSTSSKASFKTKWNRTNTENIWNFSFELLDPETLKDQHL